MLQAVITKVMEVQQLAAESGATASVVDLGAAGQLRLQRHLSLAGGYEEGWMD